MVDKITAGLKMNTIPDPADLQNLIIVLIQDHPQVTELLLLTQELISRVHNLLIPEVLQTVVPILIDHPVQADL